MEELKAEPALDSSAATEVGAEEIFEAEIPSESIDASTDSLPDSAELAERAETDRAESMEKAQDILDEVQEGETTTPEEGDGIEEKPAGGEEASRQSGEKGGSKESSELSKELSDDIASGFIMGGLVGGGKERGREANPEVKKYAEAFKAGLQVLLEAHDEGRIKGREFREELVRVLESMPQKVSKEDRRAIEKEQDKIMLEELTNRTERRGGEQGIDEPMDALARILSKRGYVSEVEKMMAGRRAATAEVEGQEKKKAA